MNGNTGHGHVWARPDGVKARCGGPGICGECSKDAMDRSKSVLQIGLLHFDELIDRGLIKGTRMLTAKGRQAAEAIMDAGFVMTDADREWIAWFIGHPDGLTGHLQG